MTSLSRIDRAARIAIDATAPVAHKAWVDHMIEHGLPGPHMVTVDPGETVVRLSLDTFSGPLWADTINIEEESDTRSSQYGWVRTTQTGRIPGLLGQIRIQIRYARQAPASFLRGVEVSS